MSFAFNTFNPHSAKERIKNHLAYKLGLVLIEYDKQRKGIPNNPLFLNEDLLSNPQSFQTNTNHKTTTNSLVSNVSSLHTTNTIHKPIINPSLRGGGGILLLFRLLFSFSFFKTSLYTLETQTIP